MFKYRKGLFISLLTSLVVISSLLEAATVPNAPGAYVGVSKLSATSVRISTKDNSNNEDGFYTLVYDYATSALVKREQVNGSDGNYTYANITGLVCDKIYSVNVVAFNNEGNSSQSDTAYFNIHSTFGTSCPTPTTSTIPNAPGAYIGVTGIDKSSVRVNFLDNSNNEDGFLLFDNTGDINVTIPENNASEPSQTYVTLTGLVCNKNYAIKALAFNTHGNSETSDERSFNIHTTFNIECNNTCTAKTDSFTYEKDTNPSLIFIIDGLGSMSLIDISQLSSQLLLAAFSGDEVEFFQAYDYLTNSDINISNDSNFSIVYISDEIEYTQLFELGGISDINAEHFEILMTEITENIASGASKIELQEIPCDINSIEVLINGVIVTSGWIYNVNSNSIVFDTTSTIQDQDQVTVNYTY